MLKKFLVLILILSLTAIYPSMVLADDVQMEEIEEIENDDNDEPGKGTLKEWKIDRNLLMSERKEAQRKFGDLGLRIEDLEKQLEEAEDTVLVENLKALIEGLKIEMKELKDYILEIIVEMKELMKSRYSEEDVKNLEKVGQGLKGKVDKVLPVENILIEKEVKFDTPPVIKHERVLIPLRAVAEGMGADVQYDDYVVTIIKDSNTEKEIKIVMDLENNTITVNGEKIETDVPAEIMNNRTMVPLRFIAEQLGLKVQWNGETETASIEE